MFKNTYFFLVLILIFTVSCKSRKVIETRPIHKIEKEMLHKIESKTTVEVGASQFKKYLPILKGKKVGIVTNQGSVIYNPNFKKYVHLVDTLLALNVEITKVFSPEHGFRGTADAGEIVNDEIDTKTGLKLISLYGSNKKPKTDQTSDLDVLVFDLQDVGVRFYTYISTLHYVMEAAAENNIPLIVLDRPNPNGHYIDGPVLKSEYKSFVGMHPVPVVYGMTIGEYALMINGEKWLENAVTCNLKVIKNEHYTHRSSYVLPVKPSPNLPNPKSVNLYPSLCFFEGTNISCGRGTNKQFQIFGAPELPNDIYTFQFTPEPNEGAKQPLFQGQICNGINLEFHPNLNFINLQWIMEAYENYPVKSGFFNDYFNTLAGNCTLKSQIESGETIEKIRLSWQPELEKFKIIRSKYLLYP